MAHYSRPHPRFRAPRVRRRNLIDGHPDAARHIRLLKTLHHVVSLIAASSDIERDVQRLVGEIASRFQFSTVAIGVIQGDEIVYSGVISHHIPRHIRFPVSQGIAGRVVRTGKPALISDVNTDPDYVRVEESVSQEICVPVVVREAVWGVLNIEATADVPLRAEEFDVMCALASAIGLAVERSQQQRSEALRLEQLAHLQRIAGRIAGRPSINTSDLDILTEIEQVFGYSGLGLGILRDGMIDVYYHYAALLDGEPPALSLHPTGIGGKVARTGVPVFARDVRDEPDYVNFRPDTTQEICVPVRAGGTVIGVLNVEATIDRTLDDSDLDILLTLADHLGTAISNHLRIAELERRSQQLHLVDKVTSLIAGQVTIRDALPLVLAEIEQTFGYGSTGIGLIEGDRIVFAALRDSNEDNIQEYFRDHGISIETGVTGRVARTGKPVFIRDVSHSDDYLPTSPAIQQEICVPIRVNGTTIGVLNVETPASKPLGSTDFEILTMIANHLGMAFERSDAYEAEHRTRTAMEAIQRIAAIVTSTLDSDEALRRIVETLAAVFDYPYVSIALIDGDRLDPAAWHGLPLGSMPPALSVGEGVAGRIASTGIAELVLQFSRDEERCLARVDSTSQIAVPITCEGHLAGVLSIEGNAIRPLTTHDLEYLQTLADHAGTTITNARRFERVQALAMRDPITNLPNYRQFQTRLHSELARSDRHTRPLSLIIIDLDSFKSINDAFGHLAGDEVLRQIGARLSQELRESDVLARYAGDEFVVILPETDRECANQIAERLQSSIETQPFRVSAGHDVVVSISVGVASYPADAATIDALVSAADNAMYAAKRSGLITSRLPRD